MPSARSAVDITVARGLAAQWSFTVLAARANAYPPRGLLIWINPFDILD
jgi:hypothetical protein